MDLSGLDLTGADFRYANLTDAKLSNSDLTSADFSKVVADGADFSSSQFAFENQFSNLPSRFHSASLIGANFSGDTLNMFYFQGADLRNANFTDAIPYGSMTVVDVPHPGGVLLDDASFSGSDLTGLAISFCNITLNDCNAETEVEGVNFSSVKFGATPSQMPDFSKAFFINTTFLGATGGNGAQVHGANLTCPDGSTGQSSCILN